MISTRVTILIPTFRSAEVVGACLRSIAADDSTRDAEVIVIDDGSGDGAADRVEREHPGVTVVRRDVNGGFVRAVNTGFAHASRDRELVAVLNDDTTVEPGWLTRLVEALDADAELGAVVPLVTRADDPGVIDSAGQSYTISGWAYRRGHGQPTDGPFGEPAEVFGPTGCAMVLRRAALAGATAIFDDAMGCYYEDTDLSFRLRAAGWSCRCVTSAVVRHRVSHSYARFPGRKAFSVARNLETVFWGWMPGRLLLRAVFHHGLLDVLQVANALRRGGLFAMLAGKLAVLGRVPAIVRRRRIPRRADLSRWVEPAWLARARASARDDAPGRPQRRELA